MIRIKTILSLIGVMVFFGCAQDEVPVENQNANLKIGVFLDSAVEGLYYETLSQSGYTNSKGEFKYLEGENIRFFLGKLELGDGLAAPVMSPITIAKTPKATINTPEVKYMAALLQTLDLDGNTKNGIKLDPTILAVLEEGNLRSRSNAMTNIVEVVKKVKEKTGIELNEVFPEQAASHLAETLGENYNAYQDLMHILMTWSGSAAAEASFEWNTKFDESGRIAKFVRMEKYPYRPSSEYEVISYSEMGAPTSLIYRNYNSGQMQDAEKMDLIYDELGNIAGMHRNTISENGEFTPLYRQYFTELDSNGYILTYKLYTPEDKFQQQWVFERLENGNKISKTRYLTEDILNDSEYSIRYEFTYTGFNDLAEMKMTFADKRNRLMSYSYRGDNTLEEINTTYSDRITVRTNFYDEDEKLLEFHLTEGEWRSEYVEFYPDGSYKLINTYYQEWHQEVATFDEDGYCVLVLQDLDRSGSYQIDYRDPNWKLMKTEYFDDVGTYLRTEIYDENGNVISTE